MQIVGTCQYVMVARLLDFVQNHVWKAAGNLGTNPTVELTVRWPMRLICSIQWLPLYLNITVYLSHTEQKLHFGKCRVRMCMAKSFNSDHLNWLVTWRPCLKVSSPVKDFTQFLHNPTKFYVWWFGQSQTIVRFISQWSSGQICEQRIWRDWHGGTNRITRIYGNDLSDLSRMGVINVMILSQDHQLGIFRRSCQPLQQNFFPLPLPLPLPSYMADA